MKTFHLEFKVTPRKGNEAYGRIAGAVAEFWVECDSIETATYKSVHHLEEEHLWKMTKGPRRYFELQDEQLLQLEKRIRLDQMGGIFYQIIAPEEFPKE